MAKNNEGRVLPFRSIPALQDLMARQRDYTTEIEHARKRVVPFVFHRNGREVRTIARVWEKACKAAGCPGRLFHDLRRTAVRNLERAGVPRSIAMKITGHKTEAVYRRYRLCGTSSSVNVSGRTARSVGTSA